MNIKLDYNAKKISDRVDDNLNLSQVALDTQILKDTQPYVPFKEGELIKSGIRASEPGTGILTYDTPYAKKLYYGDGYNFRKDRNPLATDHWFEHSKAANKDKWLEVSKRKGGFNG